jgi:hypothetical protein
MNDPIKYMLTAAGIALVSAAAGGVLVGWTMTGMKSDELRVNPNTAHDFLRDMRGG